MRIALNQKYYRTRDKSYVSLFAYNKKTHWIDDWRFPYYGTIIDLSSSEDMPSGRCRWNERGSYMYGINPDYANNPKDIVQEIDVKRYNAVRACQNKIEDLKVELEMFGITALVRGSGDIPLRINIIFDTVESMHHYKLVMSEDFKNDLDKSICLCVIDTLEFSKIKMS